MIAEVATIIGRTREQMCPTCHGSGLVWRSSSRSNAAFRCSTCPRDMSRFHDYVGTGKIFVADPDYTVDDMLAWLRAQVGSANVTIGLQSDEVGFPAHLPPGFWVGVEIPDHGSVSYINTTLHAALEYAVMGTHADLTEKTAAGHSSVT